MHKKSFTFGLGVGILFVTAVFYMLINVIMPEDLTHEELIYLAQQMGLVLLEQESEIYIPEPEEEPFTYEDLEEPAEEEPMREEIYLEIPTLLNATDISQLLYENDIIEDAYEFTQFLTDQGYSTRLRAGVFPFYRNSTFEEALIVLTTGD